MNDQNPLWVAPRTGQDWICDDTKRAVEWLKSFVPEPEMSERLQHCRDLYLKNRERWEDGHEVETFEKRDEIAWFIFQADFCAQTGRPPIDPELMKWMLLLGYCSGIRSERCLCEKAHVSMSVVSSAAST